MDFVFMDSEIDFSTYTLDELYSSARAIDRETYPDRAKEIDDLIKTRETQSPSENIVSKLAGEKATRSDRLVAAIVDGILGVVCFISVFILVRFDNLSQPTLTLSAGLLGSVDLCGLKFVQTRGYLIATRGL